MTATLAPTSPGTVATVAGRSFEHLLATTDKPFVVIDFWADWCSPCKQFAPEYAKIAAEYPQVAFCKLDTNLDLSTTGRYNVQAMPTVLVLEARTGNVVFNGELRGTVNGRLLRRKLNTILGLDD